MASEPYGWRRGLLIPEGRLILETLGPFDTDLCWICGRFAATLATLLVLSFYLRFFIAYPTGSGFFSICLSGKVRLLARSLAGCYPLVSPRSELLAADFSAPALGPRASRLAALPSPRTSAVASFPSAPLLMIPPCPPPVYVRVSPSIATSWQTTVLVQFRDLFLPAHAFDRASLSSLRHAVIMQLHRATDFLRRRVAHCRDPLAARLPADVSISRPPASVRGGVVLQLHRAASPRLPPRSPLPPLGASQIPACAPDRAARCAVILQRQRVPAACTFPLTPASASSPHTYRIARIAIWVGAGGRRWGERVVLDEERELDQEREMED
ncbi:hypothetical protein C8J57DRAFT_1718924 [Mycena rebaudengoi]|nr:hypothetical protein C8J57DRAFT_1718924 [Mycena rebaudengoi]